MFIIGSSVDQGGGPSPAAPGPSSTLISMHTRRYNAGWQQDMTMRAHLSLIEYPRRRIQIWCVRINPHSSHCWRGGRGSAAGPLTSAEGQGAGLSVGPRGCGGRDTAQHPHGAARRGASRGTAPPTITWPAGMWRSYDDPPQGTLHTSHARWDAGTWWSLSSATRSHCKPCHTPWSHWN